MSSVAPESQASGAGLSASGITPPSLSSRQGVFLSDVVVELGFSDSETVEEAVRTAAASGKPLDRLLLDSGILDEDQLSTAVAERNGLDRVDLDDFDVDPVAATLIGRSAAMRYSALPIAFAPDGALVVAVADPSDFLGVSDIEVMAKAEVRLAIASLDKILARIEELPEEPAPALEREEPETDASPTGELVEVPPPAPPQDDATAREEIDQLRSELLKAADESERLGEETGRLRSEVDRLGGEVNRLGKELATSNEKRNRLEEDLERRGEELSAAGGERDRAREEAERLRRELDATNEERLRLREEAERLTEKLTEADEEPEASNAIALGEVVLDQATGTATIPVRVESAGSLTLSGKGVQSVSATADGAGRVSLDVTPTEKKKRKLEEKGRVRLEVDVTFVPIGGTPRTETVEVRLLEAETSPDR